MIGRRAAGAVLACAVVLTAGCGASSKRGVEVGGLRTYARRVQGGGAECPISFPPSLLRTSTVPADATILPFRIDGMGAVGIVGHDDPTVTLPGADDVEITCRFKVDALRIDIVIQGVPKGHAIAGMLPTFLRITGLAAPELAPFFATNADLPVGRAQMLPGKGHGAYTRVRAAAGDVGLVYGVSTTDPKVKLPPDGEITAKAVALARSVAS